MEGFWQRYCGMGVRALEEQRPSTLALLKSNDGSNTIGKCAVAFLTDELAQPSLPWWDSSTSPEWFHERKYSTIQLEWQIQTRNLWLGESLGCGTINPEVLVTLNEFQSRPCYCGRINPSYISDDIGYLKCACSNGYEGNPYDVQGCIDINECENGRPNPCDSDETCLNTLGGHHCLVKKKNQNWPNLFRYHSRSFKVCQLSSMLVVKHNVGGLDILVVNGTRTPGYLDPEYHQSSRYTEKSDVYSYGVVLDELITGEESYILQPPQHPKTLATNFLCAMKEKRLLDIIDPRIKDNCTLEQVKVMAKIARLYMSKSEGGETTNHEQYYNGAGEDWFLTWRFTGTPHTGN
ncbi:unnamed protein product [Microthlaspi erraticum]|uniref:Protein kinase domain-containing protein n=1 Tax=Microthlaspi erraticum TaxID=1685480 RepID=A0A6D2L3A4_9BRAS|nr:unnamed protein product [Microthlaspi erraticum]